jgi:hypothetical protein
MLVGSAPQALAPADRRWVELGWLEQAGRGAIDFLLVSLQGVNALGRAVCIGVSKPGRGCVVSR